MFLILVASPTSHPHCAMLTVLDQTNHVCRKLLLRTVALSVPSWSSKWLDYKQLKKLLGLTLENKCGDSSDAATAACSTEPSKSHGTELAAVLGTYLSSLKRPNDDRVLRHGDCSHGALCSCSTGNTVRHGIAFDRVPPAPPLQQMIKARLRFSRGWRKS